MLTHRSYFYIYRLKIVEQRYQESTFSESSIDLHSMCANVLISSRKRQRAYLPMSIHFSLHFSLHFFTKTWQFIIKNNLGKTVHYCSLCKTEFVSLYEVEVKRVCCSITVGQKVFEIQHPFLCLLLYICAWTGGLLQCHTFSIFVERIFHLCPLKINIKR